LPESVQDLINAHKDLEREVYLDLENSAPVQMEIVEAMIPYFAENAYGNPTVTHKPGWMAYEAIQRASQQIANYIGASSAEDINFIPGETEANNLALVGASLASKSRGKEVIISQVEPLSVEFSSNILEKRGFKIRKVPVDEEGFIDLEHLSEVTSEKTILVSMALVNHEIGTIEPVKEAVEIVKETNSRALFHTDASDAYGKISVDVDKLGVDLMTLSSNKILGPRGVGALYVREGVDVERLLEGSIGTQKLWPGVENTPLIRGFLKASELAFSDFGANVAHMKRLRDRLLNEILKGIPETIVNGPVGDKRVPDNVNISFLHCEGEALTIELSLRGVYVSSGSACTRLLLQPSYILTAIGREFETAHGSILMKVTRNHTNDDIDYVLKVLPDAVKRLRGISPTSR
jgi:cysteine desulfurase